MIWVALCILATVVVSTFFVSGIIFWKVRSDVAGIVFNAIGLLIVIIVGSCISVTVSDLQEMEEITNREKVENIGFNYLFKGDNGEQVCLFSDGDMSLEEVNAAGTTRLIYCEDKPS